MFCCALIVAVAVLLLDGTAATNQTFTFSGEMNITSCPITYYGHKYDKVYVGFNSSRFSICFNDRFTPGTQNDCILTSGGTADRGALAVLTKDIPTGSGIHKLLPNLGNAGKCVNVIRLKNSQQAHVEQIELGNFGAQAILAIRTYPGYTSVNVEADSQVNGLSVSKQTFQTNQTNKGVIADVSGCRLSGLVYDSNTTVRDPTTCTTVSCNVNGTATAVSDCGPLEDCQGNGSCVLNTMCTVTGSTVIDFTGRIHSVPDRCGYTLMKSSSVPGFQVLGVFQERRRRDTSFLDRVILKLDEARVQISLEQGSRLYLNKKLLVVNTTQVLHGVELSRDQTGVSAKFSAWNSTVSVHFDGHTAQIHLRGSKAGQVDGLCSNFNGSVSEMKVSALSASGCESQYEDDPDSTINCNATTQWCHTLEQAPFTTCNKHINPKSFIDACSRTLCKYPAVDGLKCQFLEAYAAACSQHSNITIEGWRASCGCSSVAQTQCQDLSCSSHEFCGENSISRETQCLCRAIFASKYRLASAFGEPVVCQQGSASLNMANCLLAERGIDYSVLHLNDPACKGQMEEQTHMVTFEFNSNTCGALVMANGSEILYKNTIMTPNSTSFGLIHRHDSVHIDFSCYYSQPHDMALSIKLKDSSVKQEISSGQWNFSLSIMAYTDALRHEAIQANTSMQLDQRVWVEFKAEKVDDQMLSLVTESCWATSQPSPESSLRYDLIINGCPNPADDTVRVEGNGVGLSNYFSFRMFQFTGSEGDVFLHCTVDLCVRNGDSCKRDCSQAARRRRSVMPRNKVETPALITLAWTY
ncbi:alpha-tectorin-like [Nelusetta ayraudi]|uniref:alpha-tectorin-like n=1 Tax=Nelusetta ayraudi TaxID=303726 RepID=UPI003F724211